MSKHLLKTLVALICMGILGIVGIIFVERYENKQEGQGSTTNENFKETFFRVIDRVNR